MVISAVGSMVGSAVGSMMLSVIGSTVWCKFGYLMCPAVLSVFDGNIGVGAVVYGSSIEHQHVIIHNASMPTQIVIVCKDTHYVCCWFYCRIWWSINCWMCGWISIQISIGSAVGLIWYDIWWSIKDSICKSFWICDKMHFNIQPLVIIHAIPQNYDS